MRFQISCVMLGLVSMLVAADATAGGIVGQWGDGGAPDAYLLHVNNGRLRATLPVPGLFQLDSSAELPTDTWVCVAMAYDGDLARLYVSGALDTVGTVTVTQSNVNAPLNIGRERIATPLPANFLDGRIDDVTVYNRGLMDAEIQQICADYVEPIPVAGLVAHYPFDGNADDASGNGNDGIVHGAVLVPDRYGNPDSAFSFDGMDDFIEVPDTGSFDFRFPVTLTAWIYLDEVSVPATSNWGLGAAILLLLIISTAVLLRRRRSAV